MASALALQCSTNWAMKTYTLGAGQFVEFIVPVKGMKHMNIMWTADIQIKWKWIVSYLYPLPSISSNLAFRLAIHIFTKIRFSRHINFISRCLQHKVIPKGFRSNFHVSIFSNVSKFNLKYLHEIQRTQNTFSHNIMRSTIIAMCSKRNELNKQVIECRSQLSNVWSSDLLRSLYTKIQALNSKSFRPNWNKKRRT